MGKQISVMSFEEMLHASQKLQQISESYREIYTQLMREASTMGSAWEGLDNLAFVDQIKGFTKELKSMADKLSSVSQVLARQRSQYIARQEHNISQARKLTN